MVQAINEKGNTVTTDVIYGITQGSKLRKLCLAEDLARQIAAKTNLTLERFSFSLGRVLLPEETSSSGIYAVIENGTVNKITLNRPPIYKELREVFVMSQTQ